MRLIKEVQSLDDWPTQQIPMAVALWLSNKIVSAQSDKTRTIAVAELLRRTELE